MKRNIKTTAVILCCTLAFSTLYGCGKDAEPVSSEPAVEETDEGKGDLIEDDEVDETNEEHVINYLALKGPSYTGLTNLTKENNEDGSYYYKDMTEDALTVITNMSSRNSQRDGQDPDAYAENFVCAVVDDTDSAKIISSKNDETVSGSTT